MREDLFLRIMDIVKTSGTGFASPSQTSYLRRDQGLDESASMKAESEVRPWRTEGRLPFPTLPKEMISELQGTLDYPPAGSFKAAAIEEGKRCEARKIEAATFHSRSRVESKA